MSKIRIWVLLLCDDLFGPVLPQRSSSDEESDFEVRASVLLKKLSALAPLSSCVGLKVSYNWKIENISDFANNK